MIPQKYIGDWWRSGIDVQFLLDNGIEVKWRKCWGEDLNTIREDLSDRQWKVLSNVDNLTKAHDQTKTITERNWRGNWTRTFLVSSCEISYRIPSYQYPYLAAQYKQKERAEDEAIRQRMKEEYEQWCRERQKKIDAILAKKPWLEDPHTGFDMAQEVSDGLFYDHQIAPEAAI